MPCPNCGGSGSGPASLCLRRGSNASVIARGVDGCYTLPKIVDSAGATLATNGSGDQVLPAASGGGGSLSLDNLSDVVVAAPASGQIVRFNGTAWVNTAAGYIPEAIVTAKGDLIAATGAASLARLALGSTGQVLTADVTTTTGVKWATPAAGGGGGGAVVLDDLTDVTVSAPATGHVLRNNGAGQFVNTPGLTWFEQAGAVTTHVALPDPHTQYIPETAVTTKGDLLAATGAAALVRLGVGATGTVLKANSATTTGLEWGADVGIPATMVDAKGDLLAATAADTVARLPVGSNGQVLTANSATTTGLSWATPSGGGGGGSGLTLVDHATPTGTTETLDLSGGNFHRVRWDATLTLSLANVPAGLSQFWLLLYHDGSTATYGLTLWAGIEWVDDAAGPILPSNTANAEAFIEFWTFNGGASFRGIPRANFYV